VFDLTFTNDPTPYENCQLTPNQVYPYTANSVQFNSCTELYPVALPQHITTPLVLVQWESLLPDHLDGHLVNYIVTGIKGGFLCRLLEGSPVVSDGIAPECVLNQVCDC
jgi:hypothetical protein